MGYDPQYKRVLKAISNAARIGRPLGQACMVLLGKTGTGKSSAVNAFFGKKFLTDATRMEVGDHKSITHDVSELSVNLDVKSRAFSGILRVTDTPGAFDTDVEMEARNLALTRLYLSEREHLKPLEMTALECRMWSDRAADLHCRPAAHVFPNVVLLLIAASDKRWDATFPKVVEQAWDAKIIDRRRPNVVVVVTNANYFVYDEEPEDRKESFVSQAATWTAMLRAVVSEKTGIHTSQVEVAFVENSPKKLAAAAKRGECYVKMPDGSFSQKNLLQAITKRCESNKDFFGSCLIGQCFDDLTPEEFQPRLTCRLISEAALLDQDALITQAKLDLADWSGGGAKDALKAAFDTEMATILTEAGCTSEIYRRVIRCMYSQGLNEKSQLVGCPLSAIKGLGCIPVGVAGSLQRHFEVVDDGAYEHASILGSFYDPLQLKLKTGRRAIQGDADLSEAKMGDVTVRVPPSVEILADTDTTIRVLSATTREDYESQKKIDLGFEAESKWCFTGGASGKYITDKQRKDEKSVAKMECLQLYAQHTVSLNLARVTIDPLFEADVLKLDVTDEEFDARTISDSRMKDFVNLFRRYGTHFVVRFKTGGSIKTATRVSAKGFSQSDLSDIETKVHTDLSAFTASGHAALKADETDSADDRTQACHLRFHGGNPMVIQRLQDMTPELFAEWNASLEDRAVPIEETFMVRPVSELFDCGSRTAIVLDLAICNYIEAEAERVTQYEKRALDAFDELTEAERIREDPLTPTEPAASSTPTSPKESRKTDAKTTVDSARVVAVVADAMRHSVAL
jgi:hypothetical protein